VKLKAKRSLPFLIFMILFLFFSSPGLQASVMEFSIHDEVKLGEKFYNYIRAHYPIVYDPYVNTFIKGLSHRIIRAIPPQPFHITVDVIRDPQINAFAGPGGHVFLNTGIIELMDNEAELAAVICHELAHVTQRHLAQNIERERLLTVGSLVGMLAGALIGRSVGSAVAFGSVAGAQTAMLKYTREEEREADQIGIQYLTKAGFPPKAMIGAFEKLRRIKIMSGENNIPPYFLTHPGIEDRISYLSDMLKNLPSPHFHPSPIFLKIKALILGEYSDPARGIKMVEDVLKGASPCELTLARAILFSRLNQIKTAEKLFSHTKCAATIPVWYREMGIFYFNLGRLNTALKCLNLGLREYPDDYFALFFRGRIYGSQGKVDKALADLKRVLNYAPEDSEVHEVMGRILGRYRSPFLGFLHFAYAALYRGNKKMAMSYIKRASALAKTREEKRELKIFKKRFRAWKEL